MFRNIKILSFICLSFACLLCMSTTTSASMNIGDITPVKDEMNKKAAKTAIKNFLKAEVFKPENEINAKDIVSDRPKKFGTRGDEQRFITLKDGTEWVGSKDGLQRFLGAIYLRKAIDENKVLKFQAVETKFMIKEQPQNITINIKKSEDTPLKNIFTINSDNFISFSRYVGDKKPTKEDLQGFIVYELLHNTGYSDFGGYGEYPNLRIKVEDNKIIVIDTEYASFENKDKVKEPENKELGGSTFTFSIADFK